MNIEMGQMGQKDLLRNKFELRRPSTDQHSSRRESSQLIVWQLDVAIYGDEYADSNICDLCHPDQEWQEKQNEFG